MTFKYNLKISILISVFITIIQCQYLEEEIKSLKTIMTSLQGKLEEFSRTHLEKMSSQMSEIRTRLDHLDKNVRLLHERSLAWEAISLSARDWEELLRVVNSKVDLLQKRQEMLISTEPPITGSSYVSRRQTLDTISGRVNSIDSKVATILKRINDDSIITIRHREGIGERLVRIEGRVSVLQDGQQRIKEIITKPISCGVDDTTTTQRPSIVTPVTKKISTDQQCEIKLILADFLENLAADDDGFDSHRATRSQGTEVLFRKIWRKFQNPVAKINRRLENLEQLVLQTNDFCSQSHMSSNKVLNSLVRGECSQVNLELRHFTTRTDEQLAQLEKKIGRQMLKLGKMLDRASREGGLPTHPYPASCDQVMEKGYAATGIYTIQPTFEDTFEAFCDLQTDGGGWTVIQRRGNSGFTRENFIRDWEGYRLGFGDPRKEFWIGNDRLNEFTTRDEVVLRVELADWEGNHTYAEYMIFRVGSEDENYVLRIANYSGNASDSFSGHNGKLFSTFDNTNDESPSCCPCARTYDGGWWFYNCFEAHLNGPYLPNPTDNDYFRGLIWENWRGDYSLFSSEMKIRPRSLHYKFTGRGGSPLDL